MFLSRSRFVRPSLGVAILEERCVPAVSFQFDYSLDASHFFLDASRKQVLQQAAADLSSRLGDSLSAISPSGFDTWTAVFDNPATGSSVQFKNLNVPKNVIIVYVGSRALGSSEAGQASTGFQVSGIDSNWIDTVVGRGQAGALTKAPTDVGPWGGSITFDSSANWFFNSSSSGIGNNQTDFYSVALHELTHLLGVGSSAAWSTRSSGGLFVGPNAEQVFGGPVPLSTDGGHWDESVRSAGALPVMVPVLPNGTATRLTPLDLAGLQDIGWQLPVSASPAPSPGPAPTPTPTPVASGPPTTHPLVVGADAGGGPQVNVYDAPSGELRGTFDAFGPSFTGGVRVATGDVDGDGIPDIIVAPGPGGGPTVRVFSGATVTSGSPQVIRTLDAFEPSFTGGVFVASGDFDRDGIADIVVSADQGGGPRVRILSGKDGSVIADFLGIDDPNFRGGARIAVGDVNGDGTPDLIVGAGFGGGPRVAVFDGRTLRPGATPGKLFADFFVFEQSLRNGVYVAAGDLNGDGHSDLIFGGGPGGGPRGFALSGRDLITSGGATETQLANFFAGDTSQRGGVRVDVKDVDSDGRGDIITGAGPGAPPQVSVFLGKDIPTDGQPTVLRQFNAFDPAFVGGVFVG